MLRAEPDDATVARPSAIRQRTLSGWGGRPRSVATVHRPERLDDLLADRDSSRGTVTRGLGRSYGDAAQLAGGTVVDMTGLAGVIERAEGTVTAWAGTSLADLIADTLPRGWFLPVTPGTRHVTLGGAIAADVHGKNHHRDGSFGSYVTHLQLLTADRRLLDLVPGDDAFAATVGGMGLTGTITRATLRLAPVETGWLLVNTIKADDLDGVMGLLSDADEDRRHTVAWVDLRPRSSGRGIVMAGDHAAVDDLPSRRRREPYARNPRSVPVPALSGGIVNTATVGLFNRLWFAKAPRSATGTQSIDEFFYPLDALDGWNRLYGDQGFLQYQFVVPHGEAETLRSIAEAMAAARIPVSLAVLKRMGPMAGGMLSFPMEGWTLTVDMPLGDPGLGPFLDSCDRVVSDAGGRVYFAKDSRLRAEAASEMYPQLDSWREVRARLDPEGVVRSDLADRLALI